ncbi:MAG: 4'-phosphopantetheinyl transferase superfamily protein [Lachnospiraceae bacterium]|nr:4'-phosphopantetheinyl transferase superfamily protein [Lachnospiraceae bacterium]
MGYTDKTKICIARTDIIDECLFNAFYEKVSEERRVRTDAYRFDKDRRLSLGAEILLTETLRRYGFDPKDGFRLGKGENGKPYLDGQDDIYFNLSHSGDYVMCAVSDRDIGCDIQKTERMNLKTAERFFLKQEYETITGQESDEKIRDMFFRYWVLKECFLKVTGRGLAMPLNSFEIITGDEVSIVQNYDNRNYYFREFSLDGYKAAVCTADRICDADIEEIDLRNARI